MFNKQTIKQIMFLFLILVFIIIITKNISKIEFSLIFIHWQISLAIIGLAFCFIALKSFMLYMVGNLFHINKNYFHFVKVFCMSCFFEVTTFTGKIGADGFKFFFWKKVPKKRKISLLLFLRTADMFGFTWLLIFLMLPWKLAFVGMCLITIFIFTNLKQNKINYFPDSFKKTIRHHWGKWVLISFISTTVFLIMVAQLSVVFNSLGLDVTKKTTSIFLTSHGLGVLSQLPFGLGVKDFSIFYQLKGYLTQSTILLGLIWTRLLGEMVIVVLGGIFSIKYLREGKNNFKK